MEIFSYTDARVFGTTMMMAKEIGVCAKTDQYYKGLYQQLPDFIDYDYAPDYFFGVFELIKNYVGVYGEFPDNDDRQRGLCEVMDHFKYDVFDKDAVKYLNDWTDEGIPLVISNPDEAELLMTVVSMVNAIAEAIQHKESYFVDLSKLLPSIFNEFYKDKGIKRIVHDVLEITAWYIDMLGWPRSTSLEADTIKENYDKLQKLMNKQK